MRVVRYPVRARRRVDTADQGGIAGNGRNLSPSREAWRIGFGTEIHKFTNSGALTTGSVQGIQDYTPQECRQRAPRMPNVTR